MSLDAMEVCAVNVIAPMEIVAYLARQGGEHGALPSGRGVRLNLDFLLWTEETLHFERRLPRRFRGGSAWISFSNARVRMRPVRRRCAISMQGRSVPSFLLRRVPMCQPSCSTSTRVFWEAGILLFRGFLLDGRVSFPYSCASSDRVCPGGGLHRRPCAYSCSDDPGQPPAQGKPSSEPRFLHEHHSRFRQRRKCGRACSSGACRQTRWIGDTRPYSRGGYALSVSAVLADDLTAEGLDRKMKNCARGLSGMPTRGLSRGT